MSTQKLIWILWPSFIVGGIAEGLFFTIFDPLEMSFFGQPLGWSRMAVYSVGFFVFWGICAASSAFTCFLQRSSGDINRGSLAADARTAGRDRRGDADSTRC